jgi:uncharacterized membrane protein YciS (DUF1049 family)
MSSFGNLLCLYLLAWLAFLLCVYIKTLIPAENDMQVVFNFLMSVYVLFMVAIVVCLLTWSSNERP